ncbi:MAG TPA: polyamine ABC transporter substrate-binding protein [Bauldia sp.]|nr:polyamine ABC transporter substrate-binding protein [Bauldia sp.]
MLNATRGTLAAAVFVGFGAAGAVAQDQVVNVYNWSDYIDESVLEEFTKETGIKVVYDVYDNNDIVETKLLAGGSGYDIVVPTDSNMARQIKAGTLMKLDKSKLPNLVHMWPFIMDKLAAYDPGNEYAVDYMWGTTGLGINVDKVKERLGDVPLNTWDLLFKPEYAAKLADCGIHVLDAPEDVLQSTLAWLGLDPNTRDPADFEKAGEALKAVRPYIQKFHSSEYINGLANGDICLALGFSGDILQARDRAAEAENGVTVEYEIPKEGALMWFDSFVVPADAPHPDAAHAFINFMMKPDVAAKNSNYVYYANGNKDSQPLLAEDVIGDPAIYPDEETLGRLFTSSTYDPKSQRLITRMWTSLKAGE